MAKNKQNQSAMDRFELQEVRLLASQSRLHIEGGVVPTQSTINVATNVGVLRKQKLVHIDTKVDVTIKNTTDSEMGTVVGCLYQTILRPQKAFPRTISDEDKQSFAASGTFLAWPYIRQFVQSTVTQMGLPPVVLPLFRATSDAKYGIVGQIGADKLMP